MANKLILLALSLLLWSACCFHRINRTVFYELPIEQQVEIYEKAWSQGCVRADRGMLLRSMASRGYEAADLMVARLLRPTPNFPIEDAITVLWYIHFNGYDLVNHKALSALQSVAEAAEDPAIRTEAREAAEAIRSKRPPHRPVG